MRNPVLTPPVIEGDFAPDPPSNETRRNALSDIEARAQRILSTTGLRTSQVDAMLAEVEQALTAADAKLVRVRKAVADIRKTAKTLRALQRAEDAAARLREPITSSRAGRLIGNRQRRF